MVSCWYPALYFFVFFTLKYKEEPDNEGFVIVRKSIIITRFHCNDNCDIACLILLMVDASFQFKKYNNYALKKAYCFKKICMRIEKLD